MDEDDRTLKWFGSSTGVSFTLGMEETPRVFEDEGRGPLPAWATDVRAVLPRGETRGATVEGNELVFRPPLPEGSRILFQERLLYTVED